MFYFKLNEDSELRLLEPRHAENLFNLTDKSRNYLREWLPWVDVIKEKSNSKGFIEGTMKQFSNNNCFQAGIWYKGELAGVIGLHGINWANKSTSLGYWLGEEYQGKGLMTNACKSVIEYCFNVLNLKRIEIRAATENLKSQAIPKKLGFQKEGCIRSSEFLYDRYVDHYVYGLINEDFNRVT
ncbi:GNAT family N-acetyltransferase [Salinibacillus xinjiangensis]|uniref:GNAT family N-acetyltransferase n=1 Tax=Salinibacillus xinjiangensis TaxID=1229268 RepID=A0A6G1X9H8_9BACI|nr:GNAT family protein [Salinibacillus xinjiangensis]MRG87597.1 GNAT family N-acetyltransferase [Salinibacillus xinjiangensis]